MAYQTSSSKTTVPTDLYNTLQELYAKLCAVYGTDFSYTVAGRGEILSAHNASHGIVLPVRNPAGECEDLVGA